RRAAARRGRTRLRDSWHDARDGGGDPGPDHPLLRRAGSVAPAMAANRVRPRALAMEEAFILTALTLAATLRMATPLILCATGGLFSERSGIIDVGLEGKMLMAAFFAAATAAVTGSAWAGVLAAIAAAEA